MNAIVGCFAVFLCAGVLWAEKPADRKTYLAGLSQEMQVKWPRNRVINIVCHGHSVPAGYFKTPVVDSFNAYPHLLHKELKSRAPFAVMNVIVTAIGGESSDRGAERFERDVLSLNPEVVTIDYGLNDRRIGLKKARESWVKMIEAAKANGVKILLLTPTGDLRATMNDLNDPLNQHAQQIRELAKEHEVGLVDSMKYFASYEGEMNDLMSQINHPNRKGHDLVVRELMKWFLVK